TAHNYSPSAIPHQNVDNVASPPLQLLPKSPRIQHPLLDHLPIDHRDEQEFHSHQLLYNDVLNPMRFEIPSWAGNDGVWELTEMEYGFVKELGGVSRCEFGSGRGSVEVVELVEVV
ncbi:hypothetical protein M758_8G082700, partial [Ceratodon purpureus]